MKDRRVLGSPKLGVKRGERWTGLRDRSRKDGRGKRGVPWFGMGVERLNEGENVSCDRKVEDEKGGRTIWFRLQPFEERFSER